MKLIFHCFCISFLASRSFFHCSFFEFGFSFIRFEGRMQARPEENKGAREQGRKGGRERGSKGPNERGSNREREQGKKGATERGSYGANSNFRKVGKRGSKI